MRNKLAFGMGLALLLAGFAHAFVPSKYLVDRIVLERKGMEFLQVSSEIFHYDDGSQSGTDFRDETFYDAETGILSSRALDGDRILYASDKKLGKPLSIEYPRTVAMPLQEYLYRADKIASEIDYSKIPLPNFLLISPNPIQAVSAFGRWGVPVRSDKELYSLEDEQARRAFERISLQREGEKIFWVIGRKRGFSSVSELWIEKDVFLPWKLVWNNGGSAHSKVTFVFENFQEEKGVHYPAEVTLYSEENIILKVHQKFTIGPRQQVQSAGFAGFSGNSAEMDEELREAIELFYTLVR